MPDRNPDLDYALRKTTAVILAGGKGARLHDLGAMQAKPAVPFGGSHRLIDFPLSNCINSGIRRIGVATQYRAQSLLRHLNKGWSFLHRDLDEFIEPWPAEQAGDGNGWYKGTADAVFQSLRHLGGDTPEHILVLAGDHVYKQDYRRMLAEHIQNDADATISCVGVPTGKAQDFGIVAIDATNSVKTFIEKPKAPATIPGSPDTCLASMGIYLFKADFLAELLYEDHHNSASSHDFGHDLLPRLVGRSKLYAHQFTNSCRAGVSAALPYWRDVGTLDAYWRACLDLTDVHPPLDLYDTSWPIRTAPEQRPAARIILSPNSQFGQIRNVVLAPGAIIEDTNLDHSIVSADVHIAPHCCIKKSVLLPGSTVGEGTILHKTVVSEGCTIPENMAVGLDAEEDKRWFTRTADGVTLVTPHGLQQRMIGRKLSAPRRPANTAMVHRKMDREIAPRPGNANLPAPLSLSQPSLP
ncbi:glucose-1-phosphate adenylyltransferase [Kordiimonas lipolytica]|uniref:Glucose-1-phosphate adenylyltransferase n=1 Tax=Kordiimonas lipolytica TaxID=1662421 RepID=A0ABV8U8N6_9PROT|nr:glucose-1-phosphate adenylyltransferase [Kordiimonas lipolytica]